MQDSKNFTILIVPGVGDSGAEHWQTFWEEASAEFQRVQQTDWDRPVYAQWAARLSDAVKNSARPVIIVAHRLGTRLAFSAPRSCCSIQVRNDLVPTSSFLLASAIVRPCSITRLIASRLNSAVKTQRGMRCLMDSPCKLKNYHQLVQKIRPRSVFDAPRRNDTSCLRHRGDGRRKNTDPFRRWKIGIFSHSTGISFFTPLSE